MTESSKQPTPAGTRIAPGSYLAPGTVLTTDPHAPPLRLLADDPAKALQAIGKADLLLRDLAGDERAGDPALAEVLEFAADHLQRVSAIWSDSHHATLRAARTTSPCG